MMDSVIVSIDKARLTVELSAKPNDLATAILFNEKNEKT